MKVQAGLWQTATLIAALCATACASLSPPSVRQIVSTTSFGMCVGYCTTRLEISEGQALLIREARGGRGGGDLPAQRIALALSPDEWREIESLAQRVNLSALPAVIGCPDCADGGAESLTIATTSSDRTVTFDHGAALEPAQPLLERVRALRAKMTPAQ